MGTMGIKDARAMVRMGIGFCLRLLSYVVLWMPDMKTKVRRSGCVGMVSPREMQRFPTSLIKDIYPKP